LRISVRDVIEMDRLLPSYGEGFHAVYARHFLIGQLINIL